MTSNKSILLALCATTLVLVSGCGGGGGGGSLASSGGVGTGGTGITFGTVTGFGSVVLDGTAYSSATANYTAGTDQDESARTTSTTVDLGDRVQMEVAANGNPSSAMIIPALVGTVTKPTASGFLVNGVEVTVNSDPSRGPVTYYTGFTGLSGVTGGTKVEVHGAYGIARGGSGYIQATHIVLLPDATPVNRVTGTVSNFDSASGSFQIGAMTVRLSNATTVLPAGASLADGQLVNVWSNAPLTNSGGEMSAGVVRISTFDGVSGPIQLSGLVSNLSGDRFDVGGVAVDASAANLRPVLGTLADGQYVVVKGHSAPGGGVLAASAVQPYASSATPTEVDGTVTGYVDAGNFLVRGVPIDASGSKVQFSGGDRSSLETGAYVAITGEVTNNILKAETVAFQASPPEDSTVDYSGTVSNLNASAGSFTLVRSDGSTVPVTLAPNVAYGHGTPSDLIDGAAVEIEGTSSASGLSAFSVSFSSTGGGGALPSGTFETSGVAYAVTSTTFSVNNLTVQINGITPQGGILTNGVEVEVQITQSGGQYLAQQINVDQ